jgi:lambda repressor-like predicted transcriptional regulator
MPKLVFRRYFVAVPASYPFKPRECFSMWPGGEVKDSIEEPWRSKALYLSAFVTLMAARIKRNKTNLQAVARDMGVSRSTLDRLMLGQSWPSFDVLTSMSISVNYEEIWGDLTRSRGL